MKKVFVRLMPAVVDGTIVADAIQGDDGKMYPATYGTPREVAKELLEDRITFLQSRLENLESLDDDDDPEEFFGEALDDMEDWIEEASLNEDDWTLTFEWGTITLAEFRASRGEKEG